MSQSKSPAKNRQPAQILIVDDHPIVREGLAALLAAQSDMSVCAQAEDITSALRMVEQNPPDVAVVDIALKNESGLDLIRRLKDNCKSVRILAVSMYDENLYGERVLAAGAMGYLSKQAASRNIVDAIRQVLSGKIYLSQELSERLRARQRAGKHTEAVVGVESLTDRELEVFTLIGKGLTTNEIADRLHLSIKTIETHRQKIKWKFHLKNAAELSREAAHWVLLNR